MAELFDVIELIVDIPEQGLRAGMQGTIVERHSDEAYEVEFTNEHGETISLLTLHPDQFIVIWRAKARAWVPISEQITALVARLPEDVRQEVLDFARFLYMRKQRAESSINQTTAV